MQEPFKFCPVCRAQNNLSAQFCQQCGAKYGWAPPQWAASARPKQTGKFKLLITLCAVVFGCCAMSGIISMIRRAGTTPSTGVALTGSPASSGASWTTPAPTVATSSDDYEKIVYNDLGRMTIKGRGGELTSIKLDAISQAQKEKLQAMLIYLEVSNLTAQRACSLTLSFGGWRDRGDIRNCSGDRVGTLNDEAVGYMRDRVNAILQGTAK